MVMQKRTILASAVFSLLAAAGATVPAIAGEALLSQTSPSQPGGGSMMQDPNRPDATSTPENLDVPRDQRDAPPTSDRQDGGMQRGVPGTGGSTIQRDGTNPTDPNRPDATSTPENLDVPRDQRDAPPTSDRQDGTLQRGTTNPDGSTLQRGPQIQQPTTGESSQYRDTVPNNVPGSTQQFQQRNQPNTVSPGSSGNTIQRRTTVEDQTIQRRTTQPGTTGQPNTINRPTTLDNSTGVNGTSDDNFDTQAQPVRGLW